MVLSDTTLGFVKARDAVIGETPAALATSWSVAALKGETAFIGLELVVGLHLRSRSDNQVAQEMTTLADGATLGQPSVRGAPRTRQIQRERLPRRRRFLGKTPSNYRLLIRNDNAIISAIRQIPRRGLIEVEVDMTPEKPNQTLK
jgi:hypothetical protein